MVRHDVPGRDRQVRSHAKIETFACRPNEQGHGAGQHGGPESDVDGKIWAQNNGFAALHRLDLTTGAIETFAPFKESKTGENHNIYDIIPDSKNNV